MDSKRNNIIFIVIAMLIGACFYFICYGFNLLNFQYDDWLLNPSLDITQHYIGWEFFRNAPWSFPLGVFDTLSYPIKTSILNTDSIPLFAIFFKIFSSILPHKFQYFGLWGLLCYMLQSACASFIFKKFVKQNILGYTSALFCGAVFALLPSFALQLYWHSSLTTHWILLLCLMPFVYYEEFSYKSKLIIFVLCAILASCVHPYMVVMCFIIVALYTICEIVKNKKISFKTTAPLYSFLLPAVFVMYIIGAFSMNSAFVAVHLETSSFNLNGFINSNLGFSSSYSSFIKPLPQYSQRQVEGFAYLGLGIFISIIISFVTFIIDLAKKTVPNIIKEKKLEFVFLIIAILISVVISLSPKVTFGKDIIFDLRIPDVAYFWSIFRATGRFIFLACCIIPILSLAYILARFKTVSASIIMTVIMLAQLLDSIPFIKSNGAFNKPQKYEYALDMEPLDNAVSEKDAKVIYMFTFTPYYPDSSVFSIAQYAVDKGLYLSNFYFARGMQKAIEYTHTLSDNPGDKDIIIYLWDDRYLYLNCPNDTKYYYYDLGKVVLKSKNEIKSIDKAKLMDVKQICSSKK